MRKTNLFTNLCCALLFLAASIPAQAQTNDSETGKRTVNKKPVAVVKNGEIVDAANTEIQFEAYHNSDARFYYKGDELVPFGDGQYGFIFDAPSGEYNFTAYIVPLGTQIDESAGMPYEYYEELPIITDEDCIDYVPGGEFNCESKYLRWNGEGYMPPLSSTKKKWL